MHTILTILVPKTHIGSSQPSLTQAPEYPVLSSGYRHCLPYIQISIQTHKENVNINLKINFVNTVYKVRDIQIFLCYDKDCLNEFYYVNCLKFCELNCRVFFNFLVLWGFTCRIMENVPSNIFIILPIANQRTYLKIF